MKNKPLHPEPPPVRSGKRSETHKDADPPSEPNGLPPEVKRPGITPRTFRIASLLTAVVAAVITAGGKYLSDQKAAAIPAPVSPVDRTHSVKFHESGFIRDKPLRAERTDGFKRSFGDGNMVLPADAMERSYAVYDPVGDQFLGTLTVPDASCTAPILIEMDRASAFWKPALKTAKNVQ